MPPNTHLHPVLIASPVRRSGTTLLQRLLCSAPNALIYGENCANELQIFSNILLSKQLFFQSSSAVRDELLERVLAGEVNDWIADLMPPMAGYQAALQKSCLSIFEHYQQFAQEQGRNVWGMKMAEWHPSSLQQLQQLLPQSRLLYIHRPLADCVRSAKRVNMVQGTAEIQQFSQTYRQFLDFVEQQYPHQRLLVDYERLLAQPELVVSEIEAFTGAKGIQISVLQERINTFKSDLQRDPSGQGYLNPVDLTAEEKAIVDHWERQEA
ncbi:MAG: sulfotransferase [Bacteroidota bacterium]